MGQKYQENWLFFQYWLFFQNEFRASLDGFDVWTHDWILHERPKQARTKHHQHGGGVMFLAEIVGSIILWTVQATEDIKLKAQS